MLLGQLGGANRVSFLLSSACVLNRWFCCATMGFRGQVLRNDVWLLRFQIDLSLDLVCSIFYSLLIYFGVTAESTTEKVLGRGWLLAELSSETGVWKTASIPSCSGTSSVCRDNLCLSGWYLPLQCLMLFAGRFLKKIDFAMSTGWHINASLPVSLACKGICVKGVFVLTCNARNLIVGERKWLLKWSEKIIGDGISSFK